MNPTPQQQAAYNDFFSEPNVNTAGTSKNNNIHANNDLNHPDFHSASFAPIVPPAPAPAPTGTYGTSATPTQQQPAWWKRIFWMVALETYQPYFNINSEDVQYRIVHSIKFLNHHDGFWKHVLSNEAARLIEDEALPHPGQQQPTNHSIKGKPDAYGPFWISTTLIFVLAVTSNLANYLHHRKDSSYEEDFDYDITILAHAIWVFYGYVFLIPLALSVVLRVVLAPAPNADGTVAPSNMPGWMDLVCLYGYSLVPVFPGLVLSGLLPFSFLQWMILLASTSASLVFVLRNMTATVLGSSLEAALAAGRAKQSVPQHEDDLEGTEPASPPPGEISDHNVQMVHHQRAKGTPLVGSMIGIHVMLLLILKLGFFHPIKSI